MLFTVLQVITFKVHIECVSVITSKVDVLQSHHV